MQFKGQFLQDLFFCRGQERFTDCLYTPLMPSFSLTSHPCSKFVGWVINFKETGLRISLLYSQGDIWSEAFYSAAGA